VKAVLATGNAGKARELERLLPGVDVEAAPVEVVEDGATFAENALRKARAARAVAPAQALGLGDDSGLEVAALGGEPGVRSARWAGPDDDGRNRALLERLDGVADRRAAFVCALAAVSPSGEEIVVEGRLEGSIAHAAAGREGFGYDPLFVPEGERETLATLGQARKDQLSHRARAAALLLERLRRSGAV
jgi:XTP/dITP diphosphohydrolase